MYVVVSGLPGAGKTTLARSLAERLQLPLLCKDVVKDALFDSVGVGDIEWSRKLGRASNEIVLALARDADPAVLESFFYRDQAIPALRALEPPILEVYCDAPVDVCRRRYAERQRHPGHLDAERIDDFPDWEREAGAPLEVGDVLRVDTTRPVDIEEVVRWIDERVEQAVGPQGLEPCPPD